MADKKKKKKLDTKAWNAVIDKAFELDKQNPFLSQMNDSKKR